MASEKKVRLDQLLTSRGLARSRSNAQDLVRRGVVMVGDAPASKPGAAVDPGIAITLIAPEAYVSRGAYKLKAALAVFGFKAQNRVCLDAGASTGGFTQVLLEAGARQVFAVDVGHGQLHGSLLGDARVTALEGTDIRKLDAALLPVRPEAITVDLSFISLLKVMPAIVALAAPNAWLVALIKPQFEVGRDFIGKGGLVRDASAREAAAERIAHYLAMQPGWRVAGVIPCPVTGQSGNREFLIGASHGG